MVGNDRECVGAEFISARESYDFIIANTASSWIGFVVVIQVLISAFPTFAKIRKGESHGKSQQNQHHYWPNNK